MVKRSLTYSLVFCAALISTVSTWQQTLQSKAQSVTSLVINEIAWRGAQGATSDEWIELYNPFITSVDLTGWKLEVVGKPVIELSGSLDGFGYYLWERSDDDAVIGIDADLTGFGSTSLSNGGADILLKNHLGETVDSVLASSGWYVSITDYSTMERINPFGSGSDPSNWDKNNGLNIAGTSSKGNPILGTPAELNSVTRTLFNISYGYGPPQVQQPIAVENIAIVQSGHLLQVTWETLATALNSNITIGETQETFSQGALTNLIYQPLPETANYTFHIYTDNGIGQTSPPKSSTVTFTQPLPPAPNQLFINEFNSLPASGQKEWIELYSPSSWISLANCFLSDAASTIYTFQSTDGIGPNQHFTAELSAQKLNNSGDTIILTCSGQIIDHIQYGTHSLAPSYFASLYPESQNYIRDPTVEVTAGRSPDGNTDWAMFNKEFQENRNAPNPDIRVYPGIRDLTYRTGRNSITFNWENPSVNDLTAINIFTYDIAPIDFTHIPPTFTISPTTTHTLTNLTERKTYQYRFTTVAASGNEAVGAEAFSLNVPLTGVIISEVLPYPASGDREFIELYSADGFDFNGVSLDITNTSTDESLPNGSIDLDGLVMGEDEYFVIYVDEFFGDSLRLSNTNAFISLFGALGETLGTLEYFFAEKGMSYGYTINNEFLENPHPTPGEANIFINNPPQADITLQGSKETQACSQIKFNPTGQNSIDIDNDSLTYAWEYRNQNNILLHTENKKNPSQFIFTTEQGEQFTITLSVTDPFGAVGNENINLQLGVNCSGKNRSTPQTQYDFSNQIFINELLPNPTGKDSGNEFIELYNASSQRVSFIGWTLNDGSNHRMNNLAIAPHQYLILQNNIRFNLKNTESTIQLIDPQGTIISSITYPKAEEGSSYAKKPDGSFAFTVPSPGSKNIFPFHQEDIYAQQTAKVIISKALPNPQGKDKGKEWIEIKNNETTPVSLENWKLDNRQGGSKPFIIGPIILNSNSTHRFPDTLTKIILRNTSDEVRLFYPNGSLADKIEWTSTVADGQILEREQLLKGEIFSPEVVTVTRVIDGDTIDVLMPDGTKERIRMLGVDTPETVHPFKEVEFFGKEASKFTKAQLTGKTVTLEYDLTKRGKYGRLLSYIHLNNSSFNEELIKTGHAFAYLRFPFRYREKYRQLQEEAQKNKVGLWAQLDEETVKKILADPLDEELLELESIQEALEDLEREDEKQEEESKTPEELVLQHLDTTGWEHISLNEIFPNPQGKDTKELEWIEIYNSGQSPVNLTNWKLIDPKKTLLKFSNITIGPNVYLIIPGQQQFLKNSKATYSLIDPLGQTRETVNYQKSIKEAMSIAKQALTKEWISNIESTPGEKNSIPLSTAGADKDLDGISDSSEIALGLSPISIDTDGDTYPDDFELEYKSNPLTKSMFLEAPYRQYLADSLTMNIRQTTRTLTFSGTARPYTTVQLTLESTPQIIHIPVTKEGTWKHKVKGYLDIGSHTAQVSAADATNRTSTKKPPISFSLNNKLNAGKGPKLARTKRAKTKKRKPTYIIRYPQKEFQNGTISAVHCQDYSCQVSLEKGSTYKLKNTSLPAVLANLVLKPQTAINYIPSADEAYIEEFHLIPPAFAATPTSNNSRNQPLVVLGILFVAALGGGVREWKKQKRK